MEHYKLPDDSYLAQSLALCPTTSIYSGKCEKKRYFVFSEFNSASTTYSQNVGTHSLSAVEWLQFCEYVFVDCKLSDHIIIDSEGCPTMRPDFWSAPDCSHYQQRQGR